MGRAIIAVVVLLALAPAAGGVPDEAAILFDEIVALTREHFHDPDRLGADFDARVAADRLAWIAAAADDDARTAIVRGLLASLETSHTGWWPTDDPAYAEVLEIYRGGQVPPEAALLFPDGVIARETIGLEVKRIDGRTFASMVHPGGRAAEAGVVRGDEIVAADDAPYHGVRSLAGHEGETVRLLVQSTPDPASRRVVEVVVERLPPSHVFRRGMRAGARVTERDGRRIAIVHVWSYAGEAYHDVVRELLGGPPLADADALVFDLRGGWGGANPSYLSLFDRDVPSFEMVRRDGTTTTFDPVWRKPVAMLVDEGTRSGKEILAYGFQRAGLGPIVGMPTAGAVVPGRGFVVSDGSLLVLAVADLRVDGVRLEGAGVAPDVVVNDDLPHADGADPQLDAAVEAVIREIPNGP